MKVYISVPISGHNLDAQRAEAAKTAEMLASLGHEAVNPFDTPEPLDSLTAKERYAYFMGEDIKRLLTCDAIYFCDGWSKSRGCCVEFEAAYRNDLRCYYRIEDLPKLATNE